MMAVRYTRGGYGLREENCGKIYDYLDELKEGATDFSEAEIIDTDFSNQDCQWVNFENATFNNVGFDGADLAGSRLGEATFWKVQLNADLTAASLYSAEFNETSLNSAELQYTELCGVDLSRTGIEMEQINNKSCWCSDTIFPSNIDIDELEKPDSCD